MIKKTLKNKKFIWVVLSFVTIGGSLTAVLIPVFKNNNSNIKIEKRTLNRLEDLAYEIINADENDISEKTQYFYGLEYKNDDDIKKIIHPKLKNKYLAAQNFANYIIKNKLKYDIKVVFGNEKNTDLEEILFIFRNKKRLKKQKNTERKILSQKNKKWQTKKIDQQNDEFAILYTFFKDKVIKIEFQPAKARNITKLKNYQFRDIDYDKIKLFLFFKKSRPTVSDFNINIIKSDDNLAIINAIKIYILGLRPPTLKVTSLDLERKNNLKIDFDKKTKTSLEIIFEFENYREVKIISDTASK